MRRRSAKASLFRQADGYPYAAVGRVDRLHIDFQRLPVRRGDLGLQRGIQVQRYAVRPVMAAHEGVIISPRGPLATQQLITTSGNCWWLCTRSPIRPL